MSAPGKGKRRIGLPHMDVRVDEWDLSGLRKRTWRERGSGCSGG